MTMISAARLQRLSGRFLRLAETRFQRRHGGLHLVRLGMEPGRFDALRMDGGIQASDNRWRFSGKEEQSLIASLNWLDFGARMYDPFLGRWTTQDPLAEKYPGISPYAYCAGKTLWWVATEQG